MNQELAIAFDEFGLRSLVEGFLSQVHYHPDPGALGAYLSPGLRGDPSSLYPDPGPAQILDRQPWLDGKSQRRLEQLRFRAGQSTFEGSAYAFWADEALEAKSTVIMLHGGLVGTDPRGLDLRPYLGWCEDICDMGINVILLELPNHLGRTPLECFSGELFISGDLIRTLALVAQAVAEVRALVGWLEAEGFGPCGILGMSLGGFVSTQVLASEPRLTFATLLAPVPHPARTFSESLLGDTLFPDWVAGGLTLGDLEGLFAHVRPASFTPKGPKAEDILLIAARYDQAVALEDMTHMAEAWGVRMTTFDLGHFGLPGNRKVKKKCIYPFLERFI